MFFFTMKDKAPFLEALKGFKDSVAAIRGEN